VIAYANILSLGSRYEILVPLNDPALQEQTLRQLHQMPRRTANSILFHFCCYNPTMNIFAERVHPSSLVSFRSNDKVMCSAWSHFYDQLYITVVLEGIEKVVRFLFGWQIDAE
jgi:hypothetical protein